MSPTSSVSPSGSPSANSSSAPRSSGRTSAIPAETSSASEELIRGRTGIRQIPSTRVSARSLSAPRTNSHAYSALPRLLSHTHWRTPSSTGPPTIRSTSCPVSSPESSESWSRAAPASFHSDSIASGQGSALRTVANTNAVALLIRCRTSAAEVGSSSCASSTPTTSGRPPARSAMARTRGPLGLGRRAPNGIAQGPTRRASRRVRAARHEERPTNPGETRSGWTVRQAPRKGDAVLNHLDDRREGLVFPWPSDKGK